MELGGSELERLYKAEEQVRMLKALCKRALDCWSADAKLEKLPFDVMPHYKSAYLECVGAAQILGVFDEEDGE